MKRSKFNLSHNVKLSANMGQIVPIMCEEVLPGDSFQHSTSMLLRCSPLLAPVMHMVDVQVHHWFVPNRILWKGTVAGDNWEDFITGGEDGTNSATPPYVTIPVGGFAVGSLADYLGLPTTIGDGIQVSALPFRAYSLIFNENYRDEDLVTKRVIATAGGSDTTTDLTLATAAWEKDYFTSARPWAQKGSAVMIPVGDSAPVYGTGKALTFTSDNTTGYGAVAGSTTGVAVTTGAYNQTLGSFHSTGGLASKDVGLPTSTSGLDSNAYADLSQATGISVEELREYVVAQKYEEDRAKYGSRYVEYLMQAFGVRASDARLQRPEYLGGGKQIINFSEVLQTGVTTDGNDTVGVGNLKGHGVAALRSNKYRKFFEEHGFVISVMIVRPRTAYQQGIDRQWSRTVKEDFYDFHFANLGQQEVLNKELYAAAASPSGILGYQDRYDELRRCENRVSGDFRTTLDFWHMGRIFSSEPALNSTFVTCDATTRIFADTSDDPLWILCRHSLVARRVLPKRAQSRGITL